MRWLRWERRAGRAALVLVAAGALMGADVRGTVRAEGAAASGSAPTGNPLADGAVARAQGSAPSTVSAGNMTGLIADVAGRLYVSTSHPNTFSCTLNAVTALTQCQAAPGAGLSLYVTDIVLANGSTTASNINIGSGTGTNCATTYTQASPSILLPTQNNLLAFWTIALETPIKLAANTELCCKNSTGSTAFSCMVNGFIAP